MRAGKLRHIIAIEAATYGTPTATGEPTPTWHTVANMHASIEPLAGKQLEQARAIVSTATHRIGLRYTAEAIVGRRVRFNGRTFAINSLTNREERNIELSLLVTEEVGGGV